MSAGALALSTSLHAQAGAGWTAGLSATLGSGWQYEGVDVGVIRPGSLGPVRQFSVIVRLGSFIDEAAILGAARGFVGGVALGLRTGAVTLAEVGHELDLSTFGADLTFGVAGYAAAKSPLPEGSALLSVAVLPGIRFGRANTMQFVVTAGPAVFVGKETVLHGFLGIRIEFPVAVR
jgi:hypothetical protein